MGIEENKAVVRGLYEGLNARDWSVFDTLLAPDYLHLSSPEYRVDREGLRSVTQNTVLRAFPDLHIQLDEIIAEGDKVMVRWTQRGTHLGPFLEHPPTGKTVAYSGINIFRVIDGQIIDDTPYWDFGVVVAQLSD